VIRELVHFKLQLGPETDRFREAQRAVISAMERIGVQPGTAWFPLTGDDRWVVMEREFDSLAVYEKDDAAFHGDKEFMRLWREMEGHAETMRVELWQGS